MEKENTAEGLRRESPLAGGDGEITGPPGCESIAEHSRRRYRAEMVQLSPSYDLRAGATS